MSELEGGNPVEGGAPEVGGAPDVGGAPAQMGLVVEDADLEGCSPTSSRRKGRSRGKRVVLAKVGDIALARKAVLARRDAVLLEEALSQRKK